MNNALDQNYVEHHYFECQCGSEEHTLRFAYDKEENELDVYVFLNQYHWWWERVWIAIKYIFGYTCKFGHWDVCMLCPADTERLIELLHKVKPRSGEKYNSLTSAQIAAHKCINTTIRYYQQITYTDNDAISEKLRDDYIKREKHIKSQINDTLDKHLPTLLYGDRECADIRLPEIDPSKCSQTPNNGCGPQTILPPKTTSAITTSK